MTRARWVSLIALTLLAVFAVGGGMFSERNYLTLKRDERAAQVRRAVLQREVDSLRSFRDSLATDTKVQEREAREQWGMIWPGEISFRISTDSAAR